MKRDFNEVMRRTQFGVLAGKHNDSFAPRSSNLPYGTFETRWDTFGDRVVLIGTVVGLLFLVLALWRGWLS